MTASDTLQNIVATILETEPANVHPNLAFAGTRLQGSLARTRLYTAITQHLGVTCQAAYTARTYNELHNAIYGTAATATSALAPAALPAAGQHVQGHRTRPGIACGIDIEMVTNLPEVADYWSDAFYSATFTPTEIAYCLLQEQPLMHFAARWCAKEALKKCASAYLQANLRTLEVAVSPSGAPYLCSVADGHSTPLPFAVSISHTPQVAVAVVVQMQAMASAESAGPPAAVPASSTPPAVAADAESRWRRVWLPWFMGSSALGLALWALVRTW